MIHAYLMIFHGLGVDRRVVRDWADGLESVLDWRMDMPGCIYLISESSAETLGDLARSGLPDRGRFLIAELTENIDGDLLSGAWELIEDAQAQRTRIQRTVTNSPS